MMPLLAIGIVVGHSPDTGGIQIQFKGSVAGPSLPVNRLYSYIDPLRIKQEPMPTIGSWGLFAFPSGDERNGFALGFYAPSAQDAVTSPMPNNAGPTDPFINYEAEWSGYWKHRDGFGQETTTYPDGSQLIIGLGTTPPDIYRHVTENNVRTKVPFTQAERVATPPAPFQFTLKTASGTTIQINATGGVSITLPAGQAFSVVGDDDINITSTANINLTAMGDTTITSTGNTVLISPSVQLGAAGGKKVVLDGDPVSGGTVHATSTKTLAT